MKDKRGRRAWIKVQLADGPAAHEAAAQIAEWKAMRQAAGNLIRAIRLYAALCRGDIGPLYDYFPGLALGTSPRPSTAHQSRPSAPAIVHVERSESEELTEALDGLGL